MARRPIAVLPLLTRAQEDGTAASGPRPPSCRSPTSSRRGSGRTRSVERTAAQRQGRRPVRRAFPRWGGASIAGGLGRDGVGAVEGCERRRQVVGRHGAREEVALRVADAEVDEAPCLVGGLHALGDHLEPHGTCQGDDGDEDRRGGRVGVQVHDEGPVDLQLCHGHLLQPVQGGVAGPEVVDRYADARGSQAGEVGRDVVVLAPERGLGDLDDEAGRGQTPLCAGLERLGGVGRPAELGVGDVDRDLLRHPRQPGPRRALAARLDHHPAAQVDDAAVAFGIRDEAIRRDDAPVLVHPADQRLGADHRMGLQADDRLVVDPYLAVLDRREQARPGPVALVGPKGDVPAQLRRLVQGVDQPTRHLGPGVRATGARDRRGERGRCDRVPHARHDARRLVLIDARQDRDELVAAEPTHHPGPTDSPGERARRLGQHLVAPLEPLQLVDEAELVQVQQDHRELLAGGRDVAQRLLDPAIEPATIEQAGQCVDRRGGRGPHQETDDAPGHPERHLLDHHLDRGLPGHEGGRRVEARAQQQVEEGEGPAEEEVAVDDDEEVERGVGGREHRAGGQQDRSGHDECADEEDDLQHPQRQARRPAHQDRPRERGDQGQRRARIAVRRLDDERADQTDQPGDREENPDRRAHRALRRDRRGDPEHTRAASAHRRHRPRQGADLAHVLALPGSPRPSIGRRRQELSEAGPRLPATPAGHNPWPPPPSARSGAHRHGDRGRGARIHAAAPTPPRALSVTRR